MTGTAAFCEMFCTISDYETKPDCHFSKQTAIRDFVILYCSRYAEGQIYGQCYNNRACEDSEN